MKRGDKIKGDPRGGHVRLYWEVIDSPAYRSLTACDQRSYLALHRQLFSFNNGDLSLPITVARHHGITNESTLAKSLRALCAVGLIAITRRGSHKRDGSRMPNLYRFTDYPVYSMPAKFVEACPASNEWKRVANIAMGKALIRKAEEQAAAEWATKRAQWEVNQDARKGWQK
jgi:hypothetical protein